MPCILRDQGLIPADTLKLFQSWLRQEGGQRPTADLVSGSLEGFDHPLRFYHRRGSLYFGSPQSLKLVYRLKEIAYTVSNPVPSRHASFQQALLRT